MSQIVEPNPSKQSRFPHQLLFTGNPYRDGKSGRYTSGGSSGAAPTREVKVSPGLHGEISMLEGTDSLDGASAGRAHFGKQWNEYKSGKVQLDSASVKYMHQNADGWKDIWKHERGVEGGAYTRSLNGILAQHPA